MFFQDMIMNSSLNIVALMLLLNFVIIEACQCNGNSEFDFTLGAEIGECRTLYPLNSPNGQPWCYVNRLSSDKID